MRLLRFLPILLAPAAACVDDPTEPAIPVVDSGAYHHFAQTGWVVPASTDEAYATGFDLDDDGDADNQTGALIGALDGIGLDLQSANVEAFGSGAVVVLHSVRADSLVSDGSVSWRILTGLSDGAPRGDGTDQLVVTSDAGLLSGAIHDGILTAGYGGMTVRVPFFPEQPALIVPLVDARVEMTPTAEGCHGRLGGAIPDAALDGAVLPQLAAQIVLHMTRHPDHEFTRSANNIFDLDDDGVATATEIADSPLTRSLFRLDLDRDDQGDYDAVSFALGFTCVPATFNE